MLFLSCLTDDPGDKIEARQGTNPLGHAGWGLFPSGFLEA